MRTRTEQQPLLVRAAASLLLVLLTAQTQSSPARHKTGQGMVSRSTAKGEELLAEHLPKDVLQRCYLVAGKCSDTILQSPLVDGANLVGSYLAVAPHDMATNAIGIAMNSGCHGNDNQRVQMVVQFLGADNDTWPNLLHLGTNGRVQVNPVHIILCSI